MEVKVFTAAELAQYDGTAGPDAPVYVSVRGTVYDVSAGRNFYGPGGAYSIFAGKECAHALAFMKVKPEAVHGDLTGATEQQLKTLADWEGKFRAKYPVVGRLAAS